MKYILGILMCLAMVGLGQSGFSEGLSEKRSLRSLKAKVIPTVEEKTLVKEVLVKGNKNSSVDIILSVVKTKAGDLLSPALLNQDLKAIYALGTFKDVSIDEEKVGGESRVTFLVQEKSQIKEVKWAGNKEFKDKDLLDAVRMGIGQAFDANVLQKTADSLKQFYLDKGYNKVKVLAEHQLYPEENKVSVRFQIEEGLRMYIKKITVKGVRIFTENNIKGQMESKESGFLESGIYKQDVFKEDLNKIINFYRNEGFIKARILSHDVTMNQEDKNIFIVITIEEGAQFKLGKISVKDNLLYTAEELLERMDSKEGKIYSEKKFEQDINGLRVFYADKGYIYAQIAPLQEFDDELHLVHVVLLVKENHAAYVEYIKIEGNTRTKEKVIRREFVIHEGDVFDSSKIQRTREKIYNLGFFEEVNIDTEAGSEKGKEALVFIVKERLTGTLSLGAGYSSVDGLLGFLTISENNLFGIAQRISLNTQFGQHRLDFQLSFLEPWLFDTQYSLGVDLYNTRSQLSNYYYNEERVGGAIKLGRRWSDVFSSGFTYRYENVNISNVAVQATNVKEGNNAVSRILISNTYDTRDNIFDANRGMYGTVSNELAGGPLGGDNHFTKHVIDVSKFFPTLWGQALGLHARLGYGTGYGATADLPIFERFFMGGTDTVRGYNERSLGVKNAQGVPLGGTVMALLNAEYKFPLIPNILKFILFYDSGATWLDVPSLFRESLPWPDSLGTGIRVTIPGMVIVIRLDYGWGLRDPLQVPGGKFHFNIGSLF